MSKKKINNRLDKLFKELDKEPEQKKGTRQEKGSENKNPSSGAAFFISSDSDAIDQRSEVNFPILEERKETTQNFHPVSSTLLSTAFRTDEKNWATLKVIDESQQRTWGTEEQLLVKQVADQLSLALENARLFQEAQRRAQEMTALAEIAREISATLELQKVMERISIQALQILHATTCAVYVPDPQFQELTAVAAVGMDANEIKADKLEIGKGIIGKIALNNVAEIFNDVSNNPSAITISGTEDIQHEHLIAAPILSKNQLSGLLAIWRVGENEMFSETELEFSVSLAQQAAIVVENVRLFAETQERAEELAILNEMARELSAEMNIHSIAETAYRYIKRLINSSNFYISFFEKETNQISFPLVIENDQKVNLPTRKAENGLTEYIFKTREPLLIPSNVNEKMYSLGLNPNENGSKGTILSWLGVPLLAGNRFIGIITVFSLNTPGLYIEHDKDLMMTVASQVAIALENARLFKDAQARARREKILREITARIRATNDPEMIAKSAVRELGQAFGVPAFIRLGGKELKSTPEFERGKTGMAQEKNSEGRV